MSTTTSATTPSYRTLESLYTSLQRTYELSTTASSFEDNMPASTPNTFRAGRVSLSGQSLESMTARIPVELYRPILAELALDPSTRLYPLLTVSKSFSMEVQRILYESLVFTADKPKPSFANTQLYTLVKNLKIVVGNRSREAEHIRQCEALVPNFVRLEGLEVRGRGFNMDTLQKWIPGTNEEQGIGHLKRLTLDASLTLPIAQFVASQPLLEELDLVGGMADSSPSDETLEALPESFEHLAKLSISNASAKRLIPRLPALKHIKIAFDLWESPADVSETMSLLSASPSQSIESVFFNTTRRDLTPCLQLLPKSVKVLSTVLVQETAEEQSLIDSLSKLPHLEKVVLNICHVPSVSTANFTNPFAVQANSASSSPMLQPVPLPSTSASPSPNSSPRPKPRKLSLESISHKVFDRDVQQSPVEEVVPVPTEQEHPLIVALTTIRPTLKSVILDEQTHRRQSRAWSVDQECVSAWVPSVKTDELKGGLAFVKRSLTSIVTAEGELWKSL